jgi:ATP-binding cassette, subfamily B, multidrug efflux pump
MKNKRVRSITLATLSQNKALLISLILCAVAVVITGLIPPMLLRQFIDNNLSKSSTQGLGVLTVMYVLVLFSIGLADFLKGVVLTTLGQKITYRMRSETMAKMHRMDPLYFTKTMDGDTVSRIINDTEAVDVLFTGGIVSMIIDLFKIVGIVLSIFVLSSKLGLVTLGLVPIIMIITRLFQSGMLKAQRRSRALIGMISQRIAETLRNMLVIKANGHERSMMDRFKTTLKQHYLSNESINAYDSLFPVVIQVTKAISIAVLILSIISKTTWITITIGSLAAAIELISNLFDPIENVGSELQSIQQAIAAIDRIDEYLAQPEEAPRNQHLNVKEILSTKPAVLQFKDVSFSYEDHQVVLKDIDLKIQGGQQVTFVGRTGVGKSTLLKLVLGLLPADHGSITLNGIDVSTIAHSVQRQLYGSVDQNFPLIKGTLKQQITLNDPMITDQMVLSALSRVGLSKLCSQAPQGIDALIPMELSLSEGQKQLLAIARAIATDPPILILDEISSGLDSVSDARIKNVIAKVSQDKIVLSVTHRLSSISDEETVVILQEGCVKNQGLAKDLKESDPWFKKAITLEKLLHQT